MNTFSLKAISRNRREVECHTSGMNNQMAGEAVYSSIEQWQRGGRGFEGKKISDMCCLGYLQHIQGGEVLIQSYR